MIVYEIQLRQNERQNSVRDKIQSETNFSLRKNPRFFVRKQIVRKKLSEMLSPISSAQSELSRTNRCLSSLSGVYIPQQADRLMLTEVFCLMNVRFDVLWILYTKM